MIKLGVADTGRDIRVQTKNLLNVAGVFPLAWRAFVLGLGSNL